MNLVHKPKVAVCISGIPRGYYCFEFLKRIALYNDVYVFLWYWNDNNNQLLIDNSWRKASPDGLFDPSVFCLPEIINVVSESDTFGNHASCFQSLHDQLPHFDCNRRDIGFYGMTYGIKKVCELRENFEQQNNIIFDCVIRARFEAKFIQPGMTNYNPDAKFILSDYDFTNRIYISCTNGDCKYGMNDCMAFSSSENMSKYCKVYDNVNELSSIDGHSPERVFYHNITKYNLSKLHQYVLVGF